jgi:peroxiredoxin
MLMHRSMLAAFFLACSAAQGGAFNSQLDVGQRAPAWKKLPGADGKRHSLADVDKAKLVVVVFTCNTCDVATGYEDRIIAFAKKHEGQVAVVAINVSTKPADDLPHMKVRAKEKKFPYPYLFDESQAIGRAYGANYTPEFFLLDGERRVVYMGSMDDSTYAKRVKENYLEAAVEAVLKGETPAVAETAPRGCRIRYPRSRGTIKQAKPESVLIDEHEVRERVRREPPVTLSE